MIAHLIKRIYLRSKSACSGMSLVETIAALLVLSLAVIVMGRLTALKVSEQTSLEEQFIINTVDAYLYDIYTDFHSCEELRIEEFSSAEGKTVMLTFVMRDHAEGSHFYSFEEQTGSCYKNGSEVFKCNSFRATGTTQNLNVAIKLPTEKRMELNIFL